MSQKLLLDAREINVILHRMACQLIENHGDFSNTTLIGIQPRGSFLAQRIATLLQTDYKIKNLAMGLMDITFYRDDFRRSDTPLAANENTMEVQVEGKDVVFIDDVLYTGRSIRSALTAIQDYGRPKGIELLTLIDRRFSRHLPIQPNYRGRQVDSIDGQKVKVCWEENEGEDAIYLIKS